MFILPGFEIAREATDRPDLQLRMQGNSFLGAFFRVSSFLQRPRASITRNTSTVIREQYEKKFGRFGDAVVESNMTGDGGGLPAASPRSTTARSRPSDRSACASTRSRRSGNATTILPTAGCGVPKSAHIAAPAEQAAKAPVQTLGEIRLASSAPGIGYHQPAGAFASVGVMAAGTGATASKYVARRETPLYIPENCTQCMECITACPDTALPNTAQESGHRSRDGDHATTSPTPATATALLDAHPGHRGPRPAPR